MYWWFKKTALLFSSFLVAYVCPVPSEQNIKLDASSAEKMVILRWNQLILRLYWQLHEHCFFDILTISEKSFLSVLNWWYMHLRVLSEDRIKVNTSLVKIWSYWLKKSPFWSLIDKMSIACKLLCWCFGNLEKMPSYSLLNSWRTYAQYHPNWGSNSWLG